MSTPTTIDLTRVPLPGAIETFTPAQLRAAFIARFLAAWDEERARDATLPAFTIGELEANPVAVVGRASTYLRVGDRQRVNDALRALFATTAKGTNLDALVARQNVQRLVLLPATVNAPAVMEGDDALLRRYLLSFDRPSAGSEGAYLFAAFTAWPQMGDARVNGRAVHGRRGDTDVVIIGPGGRLPTSEERRAVSAACLAADVQPEAVSVSVIVARRAEYAARLLVEIPNGPDAALVEADVIERVTGATAARTLIKAEIPAGFLPGVAYGPNVIKVRDLAPVSIAPDPYTVPVMTSLTVTVVVRP
ncbi:baseplate J/gp47 family protein [Aureimonas pseudogalii]|uniref:Phage-related baseplate assembly protein n=1 Tax=Aureimonas pseudogalii TaxID=1744844 RepID=A0A7W6E9Q5_9HYPH|nr:baseplate J/gp47 family protein [Aureimonas pseudogalii]MBB3996879.1 phage-related baseplate assembly protein [Aureimonas pseudogalii]